MNTFKYFLLFLFVSTFGCIESSNDMNTINLSTMEPPFTTIRGALLATRFKSFEELKKVVHIEYFKAIPNSNYVRFIKPKVRLRHFSNGRVVTSILKSGISDIDMQNALNGRFWDKAWLGLNSPYLILHKKDLLSVFNLARRRSIIFGEGDVAFYDLAEAILYNIIDDDLAEINAEDLSEKGYLNTFNHITGQAFMTSIFSEKFADFIADVHERGNMPELITGEFTKDQIMDLEKGPTDNYVDMINNEWGQELGKQLKSKYSISLKTYWTPELLANYLNDLQAYCSWALQIGFKPFRAKDQVVVTFSSKLNRVMTDNY